jgi:hypothetical protein
MFGYLMTFVWGILGLDFSDGYPEDSEELYTTAKIPT